VRWCAGVSWPRWAERAEGEGRSRSSRAASGPDSPPVAGWKPRETARSWTRMVLSAPHKFALSIPFQCWIVVLKLRALWLYSRI
jgi:hypothetical protein